MEISSAFRSGWVDNPLGVCIYCKSRRYDQVRDTLGNEHIVPLCIGGKHLIRRASCKRCEQITGRLEQKIFGSYGPYLGLRLKYGSPTRGKSQKGRIPGVPHPFIKNSIVAVSEIPADMFFIDMPAPGKLDSRPADSFPEGKIFFSRCMIGEVNSFYPDLTAGAHGIVLQHLLRILAKIGHAFAISIPEYCGRFEPVLPDLILGRDTTPFRLYDYVGGSPHSSLERSDYRLQIRTERVNGTDYVVVDINLFGGTGFPGYTRCRWITRR